MNRTVSFPHSYTGLRGQIEVLDAIVRTDKNPLLPTFLAGAVVLRGSNGDGEAIDALAVDEHDATELSRVRQLLAETAGEPLHVMVIANGSGRSNTHAWAPVGQLACRNWGRDAGGDRAATEQYLADLLAPHLRKAAEDEESAAGE